MKVITLVPHWNKYSLARDGADDWAVGEVYDHDDPTADIILGHVADANNSAVDGLQGTGSKAGDVEGRNGEEQDAGGSAKGSKASR